MAVRAPRLIAMQCIKYTHNNYVVLQLMDVYIAREMELKVCVCVCVCNA